MYGFLRIRAYDPFTITTNLEKLTVRNGGIINEGKVVALYDLKKDPNRRLQLSKIFLDIYKER